MKMKILQSIASPGYSYAAGQVVDLTKERAAEFVKHGIAEKQAVKKTAVDPVEETAVAPAAVETADAPPAEEKAVKKTAGKKEKGDADADDN